MNKRLTWALVIFMSFSVIGLIYIQFMWINDSIALKEEQFQQKVHSALQNISQRIERQEVISTMISQSQIKSNPIPINKNFKHQSSSDLVTGLQDYIHFQNQSTTLDGLEFGFKFSDNNSTNFDTIEDQRPSLNLQYSFAISDPSENLKELFSQKNKTQLDIIENVIKQLNTDKKITDRIDKEVLVHIIDEELKNMGIHTPFLQGIKNEKTMKMVYHNNEGLIHLDKSTYKIALFPHEFLKERNYLVLYFPQQDKFLIKEMSLMFYGALLCVIFIISGFFYAVNIIFRQRLLSEMKTDFINNMTHELKTPISTISLATEALNEKSILEDSVKQKRFIDVIRKENDRLKVQVDKVLQFAKLDKKEVQISFQDIDIHQLINELVSSYQLQLKERDGSINIDNKAINYIIKADPFLLKNAFSNLIDNAIKYTKEKPVINIYTINNSKGIFIGFSDNGIGIEKENVDKVFDKFYRVSSGDKHDVKGFGLGLSYVKTIVNAHNGIIKVKSELKKGTTFEVYLPYNL